MKNTLTLVALLAASGIAFAQAAAPASSAAKPRTAQQQKMSDCAASNKGKTGADYKSGMSSCLSASAPAPAPAASLTQQQKMSACASANKGKTGTDYKSSMSTCLSGK
ncbi:MAG TPA: PsiF family protein [Burkholderiaceae bacterium]|jgi:hypothetical protein|nr:PsiF family protein [Burkholderiaceae bacterium]